MKQDLCLCLTFLLLIRISVSRSEKFQVFGPVDPVVAVAGEDVVLPCYLKPRISAEALEVRWFREDFSNPVLLYTNKMYNAERQSTSYIGRTQLFRQELKAGNTSLKLSAVRGSDDGHYKCFVQVKEPKYEDDFSIQLFVKAIGKQPVISIEGYREGGVGLLCESAGWYPHPELVWRDSVGRNLTSGAIEMDRDGMDLFIMRRRLIAHKGTSRVTCHVLLQQLHLERETEFHIPDEIFPTEHHWKVGLGVLGTFSVIAILAVVLFFWKREGQLEAQLAEARAVRVILLGKRWAGKSTTGNRILGRKQFGSETEQCKKGTAVVDRRSVTVVMTPGWEDNKVTPLETRSEICHSASQCPPGPHALLLVVPEWTALAHGYDWCATLEHVELLGGPKVWAHVLVLFSCEDEVTRKSLEEKVKSVSLVEEKCGGRYHVLNTTSEDHAPVTELLEKIMTMVEECRGGYFVPEADTNFEDRVRPENEGDRAESSCLIEGEVKGEHEGSYE